MKRAPVAIHLSSPPGGVSQTFSEPNANDTDEPPMPPLDLAPSGVSLAAPVTWNAGALLPHRFTLPCSNELRSPVIGGLLSVALSCESPRLTVSQHSALWSPDFPRSPTFCVDNRDYPANSPSPLVFHGSPQYVHGSRSVILLRLDAPGNPRLSQTDVMRNEEL